MTTSSFRRLLCFFGRHHRSRGSVVGHGDALTGVCRYCRIPMYKLDGKWVVRR